MRALHMKPLITIYYEENSNSAVANMTAAQRADAKAKAEARHPKFQIELTVGRNNKVHFSRAARDDHFNDAVLCRAYLNKVRTGQE